MKLLFILTIFFCTTSFAQKVTSDSLMLYNRIYFKANEKEKAIIPLLQQKFKTDSTIKSFGEIGKGTDFYLLELKEANKNSLLIDYLKTKNITAQFDKKIPNHTCTTPVFVANDAFGNMGYWNSSTQNILFEKQLMDSIYWLVKDQYWNSADDAGENVDLVLVEIPNGSHLDLPQFDLANSYDYYRNESINFANAQLHGSEVAGTAVAKINNSLDMVGMYNVKRPFINNAGISSNSLSSVALRAAVTSAINVSNTTNKNKIVNISSAIGSGTDWETMWNLSDASNKTLIFISAGNDGLSMSQNDINTKNNHPSIIFVQAGDGYGSKAAYSSYEANISFMGAGKGLNNTGTSGIHDWSGTSKSSPGAAAATGLLWSLLPTKTALEIKAMILDPKNYVRTIANPSGTQTPILKIGYLIQNLHFDIVHDYANPVNMAVTSSINLTTSTHDIQGGTIANPQYFYQKNQTGAWVAAPNGIIATATLGVGTHKVKIEFDIAHRTNKCTEIIRGIVVNNVAVAPVKLTSFTATTNCSTTTLLWQTAQEQNSKGFAIEQSTDGVNFNAIGFVASKGNGSTMQNYNYTTSALSNSKVYFRLKQIDKDGRFEYSSVVSTIIKCAASVVNVYPNPVKDVLYLQGLGTNTSNNIYIINAQGATIKKYTNTSLQNFNISTLAIGFYMININGQCVKFVKE
jgi:hypothetical protein